MRLLNKTNIDFINRKQYAIFISSVVIIVGMISLFIKGGPSLSIDFTGGTIVQIKFDEAVEISQIRQEMDEHGFENPQIINFGNPSEIYLFTRVPSPPARSIGRIKFDFSLFKFNQQLFSC